jgi:hypothetical protein
VVEGLDEPVDLRMFRDSELGDQVQLLVPRCRSLALELVAHRLPDLLEKT